MLKSLKKASHKKKLILGFIFLSLILLAFQQSLPYLSFDYIKQQQSNFQNFYQQQPVFTITIFLLVNIVLVGLALPATAVLIILSGALFGIVYGTIISTFACTIGAIFAFLWSRYLFQDWVEKNFEQQYKTIDKGVDEEGGFYLFCIRLIPAFPFCLVNILSGLTSLKLFTFSTVTFITMLIVSLTFNYAGMQLGTINSVGDLLSYRILSALLVIAFAPLLFHRTILWIRSRRMLDNYKDNN